MTAYATYLVSLLICITISTYCPERISALTMAQVDSSMREEPKPLLILLSTDWCRYCRMQKDQLRKNKEFQEALSRFYFVEFNAESEESVCFRGKTWPYTPTGESTGIHTLAVELSGGQEAAYPAWVLLDKDYQPLFRYNGILGPERLKVLLTAMETISNKPVADFP